MNALNRSTRRRLQKLRQLPSVWEGDRRPLASGLLMNADFTPRSQGGECVLWVDGSEGLVRAMDMVPSDAGPEAVVRTLLQAMEYPHSSSQPARPQKIIVCDRELQFYLRGVLQELEITVEYAPDLPLIDEIFHGLQSFRGVSETQLPPALLQPILSAVRDIWQAEPWQRLDEEKIIAIELNYNDVETLYVSILGMLGMEFGLLMYRSLDSLKRFRRSILAADESEVDLEAAFLEQDCLFVTFDQSDDLEDEDTDAPETEESAAIAAFQAETGVRPAFGNLHPLEGMSAVLHEEEASVVLLALQALHRFFRQHLSKLSVDEFPAIVGRYRLEPPVLDTDEVSEDLPPASEPIARKASGKKPVSREIPIKVLTLPDVAIELAEMTAAAEFGSSAFADAPLLQDDLIPNDAFYSLGAMPWETLDMLRSGVKVYQAAEAPFPAKADGFPVILIQTSRPKASSLIDAIQAAGGLKAIFFNPGEDPLSDEAYDLGVLQTQDGKFHLFGEFIENDPVHVQARKKWDQRCKKTKGYCGLVIARGLKGASRGNPGFNDMMALFEARSASSTDLGLGPLQLIPSLD